MLFFLLCFIWISKYLKSLNLLGCLLCAGNKAAMWWRCTVFVPFYVGLTWFSAIVNGRGPFHGLPMYGKCPDLSSQEGTKPNTSFSISSCSPSSLLLLLRFIVAFITTIALFCPFSFDEPDIHFPRLRTKPNHATATTARKRGWSRLFHEHFIVEPQRENQPNPRVQLCIF